MCYSVAFEYTCIHITELDRPALEMISEMCVLMKEQKPKERRPTMALMTKYCTKEQARTMMKTEISNYEWREANMHRKHPGIGKPVEVIKYGSDNYNKNAVGQFLGWVDEHHLQNHAYGDKNV